MGRLDSLCLMTLGSVTKQMKSVSFFRVIVNSCIAEFDLFKFTCLTKMSNPFPRDSAVIGLDLLAMLPVCLVLNVVNLRPLLPQWI